MQLMLCPVYHETVVKTQNLPKFWEFTEKERKGKVRNDSHNWKKQQLNWCVTHPRQYIPCRCTRAPFKSSSTNALSFMYLHPAQLPWAETPSLFNLIAFHWLGIISKTWLFNRGAFNKGRLTSNASYVIMMDEIEEQAEEECYDAFGRYRILAIAVRSCVQCGGAAYNFRDELFQQEFGNSAFCQDCMDKSSPLSNRVLTGEVITLCI